MKISDRRRKKELELQRHNLQAAYDAAYGELLWIEAVSISEDKALLVGELEDKLADYARRIAEVDAEIENPAAKAAAPAQPGEAIPASEKPANLEAVSGNSLAEDLLNLVLLLQSRYSEFPPDLADQLRTQIDQAAEAFEDTSFKIWLLQRRNEIERQISQRRLPPDFFIAVSRIPADLAARARQSMPKQSPH